MLTEYKKEALEGLKEIFKAIEYHEQRCGIEAVLETNKIFLMGKDKIEFKFTAIFKET